MISVDLSYEDVCLLRSALALFENYNDALLPRDDEGLVTISDDEDFNDRFLDGRYNDFEEESMQEAWSLIRDARVLGDKLFEAGGFA